MKNDDMKDSLDSKYNRQYLSELDQQNIKERSMKNNSNEEQHW